MKAQVRRPEMVLSSTRISVASADAVENVYAEACEALSRKGQEAEVEAENQAQAQGQGQARAPRSPVVPRSREFNEDFEEPARTRTDCFGPYTTDPTGDD